MTRRSTLRPSVAGKLSEREILRVLRERGPMSRAEVARQSGLSAPTVSKAVTTLLTTGLLEEVAPPEAARGRPAPVVRLAVEAAQVLGVVLDAGACTVASAGLDGRLHPGPALSVPTPSDYDALLDSLEVACRRAMARPAVRTLGLGLSIPGLLDDRRQVGLLSPNVPITDGHAPAFDLARRLGLECLQIHELHALCLSERQHGPTAALTDFAMVDATTGVGLATMTGGRLLRGHCGLAGELGHLTVVPEGGAVCGCGNTGCLETVASDASLAPRVSARLGRAVGLTEVMELARARQLPELDDTAKALGLGLAAVVNLFNPAIVFVHSGLFAADPTYLDRLTRHAARRALPPSFAQCRILQAQGTKVHGAVAGIVQHLTSAAIPGLDGV